MEASWYIILISPIGYSLVHYDAGCRGSGVRHWIAGSWVCLGLMFGMPVIVHNSCPDDHDDCLAQLILTTVDKVDLKQHTFHLNYEKIDIAKYKFLLLFLFCMGLRNIHLV